MDTLRGHNRWKTAGVLTLFALILGIMLVVPGLRKAPSGDPAVNVPAMSR
jgi:hypothetical protein